MEFYDDQLRPDLQFLVKPFVILVLTLQTVYETLTGYQFDI